jgi:hypothetical protein
MKEKLYAYIIKHDPEAKDMLKQERIEAPFTKGVWY